jgi:hypothetical protein
MVYRTSYDGYMGYTGYRLVYRESPGYVELGCIVHDE